MIRGPLSKSSVPWKPRGLVVGMITGARGAIGVDSSSGGRGEGPMSKRIVWSMSGGRSTMEGRGQRRVQWSASAGSRVGFASVVSAARTTRSP